MDSEALARLQKHKECRERILHMYTKHVLKCFGTFTCPFPNCYELNVVESRQNRKKEHLHLHILLGNTRKDEKPIANAVYCGWCGSNQEKCILTAAAKNMKCIHHKEPNRMTKALKKGNNPQTCELKTCQKWIWSSSMENHYKRAHPQIPVPRKHINTKEIIGNAD